MKFTVNPPDNLEYLANLNTCFPNWGNVDTFNWVFARIVNNRRADLFTISTDDGILLAGSAVTFRKIKDPSGNQFEIGIMTGSWTLPSSRGMGCFSRAIEKSAQIVKEKHIPFLTAFVTESNASYRRLRDAGSFLVKTYYISSDNTIPKSFDKEEVEILPKTKEHISDFFEKRNSLLKDKIHFTYSLNEFEYQFIHRLHTTFLLKIGSEIAVVEETASNFQIHFCTDYGLNTINNLVQWGGNRDKSVFFFVTKDNIDPIRDTSGFKIIPGFFTVLRSGSTSSKVETELGDIHIEYGDKM